MLEKKEQKWERIWGYMSWPREDEIKGIMNFEGAWLKIIVGQASSKESDLIWMDEIIKVLKYIYSINIIQFMFI